MELTRIKPPAETPASVLVKEGQSLETDEEVSDDIKQWQPPSLCIQLDNRTD